MQWDGHGVYSFLGNVYEGEFVQSKRDGTGVMMYLQGDRYEGLWRDGRPSGMGTCVYANGDKYIGAWKMGQRDGEVRGLSVYYADNFAVVIAIIGFKRRACVLTTGDRCARAVVSMDLAHIVFRVKWFSKMATRTKGCGKTTRRMAWA